MIFLEKPKANIEGREFEAELGTVTGTHLGYEDHGIFTFSIVFKFSGGGGQSAGHRYLGAVEPLVKIIDALGAGTWENLKGQRAYVLRIDDGDLIRGLLSEDLDRWVIFD